MSIHTSYGYTFAYVWILTDFYFLLRFIDYYLSFLLLPIHSIPTQIWQVRLQMMCLLLGGLAIMSVRKNKPISASLFDQRKQQGQQQSQQSSNNRAGGGGGGGNFKAPDKKRSSYITENDEEIEFTPMLNQRQQQQLEMVPLVEMNGGGGMESRSVMSSSSSYDELEVI